MPLNTLAPVTGGSVATTGGTADSIADLGGNLTDRKLAYDADALAVQRTVNFTVKRPVVVGNAPGGFSPGRRVIYMSQPILLADGTYYTNYSRVEIVAHRETTDAILNIMHNDLVQVLIDPAIEDFRLELSVA